MRSKLFLAIAGGAMFLTLSAQPTITSFSPVSGTVGSTVTITGTNFTTGFNQENIVFFGAVRANVVNASSTQLTVVVPFGATYDRITVISNLLSCRSRNAFIPSYSNTAFIDSNAFSVNTPLTTDSVVNDIKIADIDGDGKPDLVGTAKNSIYIWRNLSANGASSPSFASAYAIGIGGTSPINFAIGDITGDGKLDIAIANYQSSSITLLRNNSVVGNLSLSWDMSLTAPGLVSNVMIDDIDGDGKPDVVSSNSGTNSMSIFKNISTSGVFSFLNHVDYGAGIQPTGIQGADMDGDGKIDLVITSSNGTGGGRIYIYHNKATSGSINTASFPGPLVLNISNEIFNVAIGDLNQDGKPDILFSSPSGLNVYQNSSSPGNISVGSIVNIPTSLASFSNQLTDITGDGIPDILEAGITWGIAMFKINSSGGTISTGSFAPRSDLKKNDAYRLAAGDLNADGRVDIAASFSTGKVYTFTNKTTVDTSTIISVTLGNNPSACSGSTATPMAYTLNSGAPTKYSIIWNDASISAGFVNIVDTVLSPSSINIAIPLTAASGVYSATIVFTNNNAVSSTILPFSIQLRERPTVAPITGNTSICIGPTTTKLSSATTGGIWTSGNTSIATISNDPGFPNGLVNGLANGTDTIYYNVTDSFNCSTTVSTVLTVGSVPPAPVITGQPVSVKVAVTATTSLTVSTENGTIPRTYSWQVSNNGGSSWTTISSAGQIPLYGNWTTNKLSISVTSSAVNGYKYRCIITDSISCGLSVTTSEAATLTVVDCASPTIVVNPENVTVNSPAPASFSIRLTGSMRPFVYQWQVSNNSGTTWNNITASGIKPVYTGWADSTLIITNISTQQNDFRYRCVITSAEPCGNFQVTTTAARMSVPVICLSPVINTGPQQFITMEGSTASFSITASGGVPPIIYQWQVSKNAGTLWDNIVATGTGPYYSNWATPVLSLQNIQSSADAYQYRCLVTSEQPCTDSIATSTAAILYVSPCAAPDITAAPKDVSLTDATSADFSVEASGGSQSYSFKWQVSSDNGSNWTDIKAAGTSPVYANWTSATLSLSNISSQHNLFQYRCIVSNGTGCTDVFTASDAAVLSVSSGCFEPSIIMSPQSTTVTASSGTRFSLIASESGSALTYQWQLSVDGGVNWDNITTAGSAPVYSGFTTSSLSLASITDANDGYQYRCIVTNGAPCNAKFTESIPATLSVSKNCISPVMASQPEAASITEGGTASFSTSVIGGTTPYSYQWQVSTDAGQKWTNISATGSATGYAGWTTPTLSLTDITLICNGYQYRCIITSSKPCTGSMVTSDPAKLSVVSSCTAPIITNDPVAINATIGDAASLSVSASGGVSPYTYQWQVSTTNGSSWATITSAGSIPAYSGWTTAKLFLTGIGSKNDKYQYRAIVLSGKTCQSMTASSNPAILNVSSGCTAPKIISHPVTTTATASGTTSFSVNASDGTAPYTYQWQVSTNSGSSWSNISSIGSSPTYANWTTASLKLTNITASNNNYRYRCVVSSGGPCGNYSSHSNGATLTVTNNCTPPFIDRSPVSTSAAVGSATSFSVTVGGLVGYQWQISKDGGNSWNDILSAGSGPSYANWSTANLSVSGILLTNNGFKYRCVVRPTGSCSTVSSNSDPANLGVSATVQYTVSVASSSTTAGSVTGGGIYNSGANVLVKATANAGYSFTKWTENGTEASTNASFGFTATANRTLTAAFSANVVTYIDLGDIRIFADKIPATGTTRILSGNVFAIPKSNCTGKVGVHFPSTIVINTNDNTITGTGEVYCDNVGSWGKIVILNGFFTLKASNDVFTSPIFNAATLFYKLAGLKLKITDLQVLCDGGKIEGELSLPSEFFSGKISGAINALYFTKSGINLNGKIAFKDLNLKGVIPVDELSLAFDTKTKDYSGSLTLKYPLFSVSGEFAFIYGKFDKVGVEYASNLKPIPLGTLPLAITQIHGAVSGISTNKYLFDFDATIAPAAGVAIPALGNIALKASYLYGDAFDASATLKIFQQNLASARLSVKRDLFTIGGDLNLLDVLKGHADMSITRVNGNAKLTGNFNGGLYAPDFKPLWLKPLNLAYPKGKLIASSDNYITSEYIAGRAMVKGIKYLFGDIKVFYVLKYNGFEFDWKSNKSDLPLEAQKNLPGGKKIIKPELAFSSSVKTNGLDNKVNGVSTKLLSYSFDVTSNTGTVVITATAKKTPSLSVYVAKGSIINAATAAQFNNVLYYSDSNSVVIWIKNLVPGTYYTWCNDSDSINVLSMLPFPEVNIRSVVQDGLTRKFKVDFDAYHVNNGATVAIGLDNDLLNENGVVLVDSIRLVEGANSVTVDYSKVSSGKYFLYAGITDNIGQHAFSYDTTARKIIIDSAPNTPTTFQIEKNAGKYFVSFGRNNPSPMGYQLHYAGVQEELTLQSPVIPMGDTNYAELRNLPPGRFYRLAVSAMDSIGRQSDLSNSDTLLFNSPGLNSAPYFESHVQKGKVKVGSLYNLLLQAKDADNDPLQYSFSSGPMAAGINNQGILTWTPEAADAGYQQLYVQVSDGKGGTDSMRLELQVYDSLSSTPSLSLDKAGINNYTESLLTQVSDPLVSTSDKRGFVQVHISSGPDNKGIDVQAIVSTGPVSEFSTPVNFSAGPSSGNTIQANRGDTIRISYTSPYSGVTVQNYAIFKPLLADFILTDSLCSTDTVHMFNASKGTSLRYTWTFGDGMLGSDKNPNHLFPKTIGKGNTSYQIKLTIVDLNGNTDSVTKTLTIYHVPAKTIIASGPLSFCFGDSVKLVAGGAEKYLWSTGASSAGISVNKSGVYHYISSNGSACFTMDTVAVKVNPLPTVNAGVNADIKLGTNIQLGGMPTAAGNAPFLYRWTPSAGLLSDSAANPLAVPYKPTVYTLHVTDINGCINSDNVAVNVSPVIMEDVMLVYPNPATTQIRIVIILPSDIVTNIAIYDFNGLLHKKVVENRLIKKGYQSFLVSIADLANGTYYVRFNSKQTKIFVKQ